MRHPQLLVHESDGRSGRSAAAAGRAKQMAAARATAAIGMSALVRPRRTRRVGPARGRDLERELATLEQVSWLYPDAATVLVGDSDPPWLAGLAWDLGARWVLLPPQSRERLTEIVTGLMGRYQPASAAAGGGP